MGTFLMVMVGVLSLATLVILFHSMFKGPGER